MLGQVRSNKVRLDFCFHFLRRTLPTANFPTAKNPRAHHNTLHSTLSKRANKKKRPLPKVKKKKPLPNHLALVAELGHLDIQTHDCILRLAQLPLMRRHPNVQRVLLGLHRLVVVLQVFVLGAQLFVAGEKFIYLSEGNIKTGYDTFVQSTFVYRTLF